ncbi:MAG: PCMD domain-containing protein [Fibrobacter sp.]|nr:PCMD domain-containing protein [Fibrobacter sp.]
MMKKLSSLLFVLALFAILAGCTADYDSFGTSDYRTFNSIRFVEQDGDAAVYEDEHRVEITLVEPKKGKTTWDSVTVESIDISSMATLHLVDGKFKEFPSDSAALDSLANDVSYVEKSLGKKSKIRVPSSLSIYLMVVSESGLPSIWQISFTIPGVESSSSEQADDEGSGDSDDDTGDEEKSSSSVEEISSSSSQKEESSSSITLSSEKSLDISFEGQKSFSQKGDTLYIGLENGIDLADVKIKKTAIPEGASIDTDPASVTTWKDFQTFTVTAEDGSSRKWVVAISILEEGYEVSTEKELLAIEAVGQTDEATVDKEKKTIVLHFPSKNAAAEVSLKLSVSDKASSNVGDEKINLLSDYKLTIIAEDGSSEEWTVSADYPVVESPRILGMKIAGKAAVVDSVNENGKMIFRVHFDEMPFRADLSKVAVSDIELSKGATIKGIEDGSSYDLGMGATATVTNDDGESVEYTIRAGYQLPGSDFNTWKSSGVMSPDSIWGNANMVGETTSKYTSGSVIGAQIKTSSILGKIASGSLYTAEFNPKGVGTLAMANSSTWPDGNELLDFGKKFNARPAYIDVTFNYNGSGDSCDIYLVLENRTGDMNRNRSSSDVNKLVASAWYRSTTADNTGRKNPDVVSVSAVDATTKMRTMRMKLHYGTPLAGSPIENSSIFNTKLESKDTKAIDNSLIQGTGEEPVTHIRLVFASSADGNHYKGKSGATLQVDGVRLIY